MLFRYEVWQRKKAHGKCEGRYLLISFFFFQAEDGIRDYKVTGVQTCALPISAHLRRYNLDSTKFMIKQANVRIYAIILKPADHR